MKVFDASRCKNGIGRQAGSSRGAAGTKSCVLFWMRQRLLLVSYSEPRWRDINYEGVGNHTRQNSLRLPPHSSFCSCFASPPCRSDERTQTNLRGTFRSCHKNNADKRARVRLSDFCAVAFHWLLFGWQICWWPLMIHCRTADCGQLSAVLKRAPRGWGEGEAECSRWGGLEFARQLGG